MLCDTYMMNATNFIISHQLFMLYIIKKLNNSLHNNTLTQPVLMVKTIFFAISCDHFGEILYCRFKCGSWFQHQSDIRLLQIRLHVSAPGSSVLVFWFQVMLRTSMYLTLSVYCGFSLLAGAASLILPIETLGRSLQESSLDQETGEQRTTTTSRSNGVTHSSEKRKINQEE